MAVELLVEEPRRLAPRPTITPGRGAGCWDRWLLVTLLLVFGAASARGQEPDKKYAKEFRHSFKGQPPNPADVEKMGPGNAECVTFEPEGLRITLPVGVAGSRPGTGVMTGFGVRGDFEITIGYEILREPEPADAGEQTRVVALVVVLDKANPNQFLATLNCHVMPQKGRQYFSWLTLGPVDTGKRQGHATPTTAKSGRLRLLREGADLSYLVADAHDEAFSLLARFPLGAEDVKEARITASTGGEKAALDVRVHDLHIRAAALPKLAPKIADGLEKRADRSWLMAALLIGVAIVVFVSLAGAAAFFLRKRRPAVQAPSGNQSVGTEAASAIVAVACGGCGTNLKAKAEWAGRKVNCPECGKAVAIPAAQASEAE